MNYSGGSRAYAEHSALRKGWCILASVYVQEFEQLKLTRPCLHVT